jgi:hypothetical protein
MENSNAAVNVSGAGLGLRSRSTGADNLRPVFHFLKKWESYPIFFFKSSEKTGEGERHVQGTGVICGKRGSVVESKWPFLLETVKWMVLHDKRQKSVIFKIRVDV